MKRAVVEVRVGRPVPDPALVRLRALVLVPVAVCCCTCRGPFRSDPVFFSRRVIVWPGKALVAMCLGSWRYRLVDEHTVVPLRVELLLRGAEPSNNC